MFLLLNNTQLIITDDWLFFFLFMLTENQHVLGAEKFK